MLLSCKKRKKERNLFIKTKTEYRNEEPNSFIGKRNLNAQLNYNFNPGKKGKAICGNSSSWNAVNCKIIQLSGCIIGYYWCLIVNLFGLFEQQGTKRNTGSNELFFDNWAHIEHRNASNRCYTDTKGILIRVIYEIICIFVVKNFDDTM